MDCAIRTDDAMVSRHHSRIFWSGSGYVLEDLQSANGVYYQEQRVQQHMFKHGDAVRCGSLWLRYVDTNAGPAPAGQPMMQHPGMGQAAPSGPTGHIAAVNPAAAERGSSALASLGITPATGASPETEAEIRVLRRRIEQLQSELRIYRGQKYSTDTATRMEDLENELSASEVERDSLKAKLAKLEGDMAAEGGNVKVKRALEIASAAAEASASLNDLLSSLRIEVMAAAGEFDQYAQTLPRASFELIRQSMKDGAAHCDEARELLKRLRSLVE